MLGMAYGSRLALGTLLLYLAEGAAGLPVFAGTNAGFAYMIGPTGGYLIGFVLSAGLCGLFFFVCCFSVFFCFFCVGVGGLVVPPPKTPPRIFDRGACRGVCAGC